VGIVGGDGGFTARAADACVMIPAAANGLAEPVAEALHSVVCRLLAAHPELKTNPESGKNP
jgi:D-sedoheptulose 7-phosphate isomerase